MNANLVFVMLLWLALGIAAGAVIIRLNDQQTPPLPRITSQA